MEGDISCNLRPHATVGAIVHPTNHLLIFLQDKNPNYSLEEVPPKCM